MTFLESLLISLKREPSCAKNINIKLRKLSNFSESQKICFFIGKLKGVKNIIKFSYQFIS